MKLNTIEEIIEDIRQGKMIILMDDEDRENEGDLLIAAEKVTTKDINFMATHARGLICLTLTKDRCEQLDLPLMVDINSAQFGCNFTVSIEAATGVTTGISAADRARTIQLAVAKDAGPADVIQPGHIFPVMAKNGGVLHRAGHTEAGSDLARLAGLEPSAAICEILNTDGSMSRRADLEVFAKKYDLKIGTIRDLIHYRIENEKTVERVAQYTLPTEYGDLEIYCYKDLVKEGNVTHLALVKGDISAEEPTLARVLIDETLRDLLGLESLVHPSWSLHQSLTKINEEGKGVVVILARESEEPNVAELLEKFNHLNNMPKPPSNPQGSFLTVGTGSQILRDVGVRKMRLLNYPTKYAISGFGLEVIEYIPYKISDKQ